MDRISFSSGRAATRPAQVRRNMRVPTGHHSWTPTSVPADVLRIIVALQGSLATGPKPGLLRPKLLCPRAVVDVVVLMSVHFASRATIGGLKRREHGRVPLTDELHVLMQGNHLAS